MPINKRNRNFSFTERTKYAILSPVKTILFMSNAPAIELMSFFEGINAVGLREHWNLQRLGGIVRARDARNIVEFWKPDGCIIQCATDPAIFPHELFTRIPHVYIDRNPADCRKTDLLVLHDSAETGRLAARELLSLGLENFSYARAGKNLFWCKSRFEAFEKSLALNGKACLGTSDDIDASFNSGHDRLSSWVRQLPKPVGIFASNDRTAELVVATARELGIATPDELAVISVDNCESICENTSPTLTSIAPKFSQAGFLAADLLARKLANPRLKGVTLHYGQHEVIRRQSTRRLRAGDKRVTAILEYIRLNAARQDFSFERISELVGCSLRCAEMRFKALTGKTILEELHERRVEAACRLLSETNLRISEIAAKSGFSSLATFARVFMHQIGVSPRAWRAKRIADDNKANKS